MSKSTLIERAEPAVDTEYAVLDSKDTLTLKFRSNVATITWNFFLGNRRACLPSERQGHHYRLWRIFLFQYHQTKFHCRRYSGHVEVNNPKHGDWALYLSTGCHYLNWIFRRSNRADLSCISYCKICFESLHVVVAINKMDLWIMRRIIIIREIKTELSTVLKVAKMTSARIRSLAIPVSALKVKNIQS